MTHNDYFLLARSLREAYSLFAHDDEAPFYDNLVDHLIHNLKQDNPAFSERKFKLALHAGS